MYVLLSWANQQVVTNASIYAFRGQIIEDVTDRVSGSNAMSQITKFVRSVTGNSKHTCYQWHTIKGEWSIGLFKHILSGKHLVLRVRRKAARGYPE